MTQIVLVRHGQTASNGGDPDPKMSGWTDLPLSSTGVRQVQALGARFRQEPKPDALYSSPLRRALDTAVQISQATGLPIYRLDALREINCGIADGLPISEVRRVFPNYWEENLRQDNPHFRWPGGESYVELRARSLRVLDEIAERYEGGSVVVVTHAGVISQIAGFLAGLDASRWEAYRPNNTALTRINWGKRARQVATFDDTSHLMSGDEAGRRLQKAA